MRNWIFGLLTMAAGAAALPAAGQDFSADDVKQFFNPERGVCIGTVEFCEEQQAKADEATRLREEGHGFNMMVTFELNSADLTPEAQENLRQVAIALKDDQLLRLHFSVEGHTDASGSERYNLNLSDRRADSVEAFLVSQGIDVSRLSVVAMGESVPLIASDPLDGRNRRVELKLATN